MEGEDVFEIEKIIETSVTKGIRYYKVRWKGFKEEEDTWEPEENLFDCKDVLDTYWKEKNKNKKPKGRKRKSESTSQTSKPKKKGKGRSTNNSTIVQIDSLPEKNIVTPSKEYETSSCQENTKEEIKQLVDQEIVEGDKHVHTSEEIKGTNKEQENSALKNKGSVQDSKMGQPTLLDKNQNSEDVIAKASCNENASTRSFDKPLTHNSTNTKEEPTLKRENSRERLQKRTSWSSFESSPEFVPEYCDEALAYDMCREEEYEYFGDTGYIVKDSVGYGEGDSSEELSKDESHKEVRTEGQKQMEDNKDKEDSSMSGTSSNTSGGEPLCTSNAPSRDMRDKHIDCPNSESHTAKPCGNENIMPNKDFLSAGCANDKVDNALSPKKDDETLPVMRSSSSGDGGLHDNESLSPEFAKLPDPFDFSNKIDDGNKTQTSTHESKGNELSKNDCKDLQSNIGVPGISTNSSGSTKIEPCGEVPTSETSVVGNPAITSTAGSNKIKMQCNNTPVVTAIASVVAADLSQSDKAIGDHIKELPTSLAVNKTKKKLRLRLRRKTNESNSKNTGEKSKLFLSIDEGTKELLNIPDENKTESEEVETSVKTMVDSSRPKEKSVEPDRTETVKKDDLEVTAGGETETKSNLFPVRTEKADTSDSTSVQLTLPSTVMKGVLSKDSESDLVLSENVHYTTATPVTSPNAGKNEARPLSNEQSSLNTLSREPGLTKLENVEDKTKKKVQTTGSSSSSNLKEKTILSPQTLTKTENVPLLFDAEKNDAGVQTTEAVQVPSSNTVSLGVTSPSQEMPVTSTTMVHDNQTYRGLKPGNDSMSWSSGTSKCYLPSAKPTSPSGTPSLSHVKLTPFSVASLSPTPFFTHPSSSFANHLNQQAFSAQPDAALLSNPLPKPFSAVPGINWYPAYHNQPRTRTLIQMQPIPTFVQRPVYIVSANVRPQVESNKSYARALQDIAKKRQPDSSAQTASTSFNNKESSSSIDADKAWYAKHVGGTNSVNSTADIPTDRGHDTSLLQDVPVKQPPGDNVRVTSATSGVKTRLKNLVIAKTYSLEEKIDKDLSIAASSSATAETKNCDLTVSSLKESREKKDSNSDKEKEINRNEGNEVATEKKVLCENSLVEASVKPSAEIRPTDCGNKKQLQPKGREKNKNEYKEKAKPGSRSESNRESSFLSSTSNPKQSLNEAKSTSQKTSEKCESRSTGSSRGSFSERERSRDPSSANDREQRDRMNDSEKTRENEITRKNDGRDGSPKTASLAEEEDTRSKRDPKERIAELKKQGSTDSDMEFDLDDYSPDEVVGNEKSEKVCKDVAQSGIPMALSWREVKSAIKQGDSATVMASLAGGMSIDFQDNVTGMTLLMRAVSCGQENIVRLLLHHGANVNIKDNTGSTPLIQACEQGFEDIVSLLLNGEIDINAKQTLSGETALIKACIKGHYSVVALLLVHGADCQMRSVSGLTAAQLSVECGHFDIRDLLESHSKKLQRCVETAIASCLCNSSKLMYPPLLPFVSLYPAEGQKFTYHFHCSNLLIDKRILLFCLRAVFSRSGQVDLSFSKDNGVHTVLLNGSLQSPVLHNNKSVFVLQPKLDTNRLTLQAYQSHVHLLVCIYAVELDENVLNIEPCQT